MGPNGLCVTTGGNLPAKNVLHLAAAQNYKKWKTAVFNSLMEAEGRKWSNITFPALGTGSLIMYI
jgi:O-acetyl-ADP-ribose deacetylase (regulator of RNase III)